jgi:uncharacterized Zn finger protein
MGSDYCTGGGAYMLEASAGDEANDDIYVLASDHDAALATLSAERDALSARVARLEEALRAWVESTSFDEQTGSMRPVYEAARAAIRRATGEPA